jgi:hypothetical protein
LTTRQEVFADRGYLADGSLVPRSQPGALIDSEEQALAQTLEMVQHNRVRSITGEWAHVIADTVCLMATASTRWILRAACVRRLPGAIFRSARKQKNKTIIIKALQHSQQHSQRTGRYHGRSDISGR